jgi:hypothetical protein
MMICSPRGFALAMMVAGLPLGYAFAGGSGGGGHGGGGLGGGVGAAGMGSAAVGGGAPAGRVGGGPAAGAVGGGAPGSSRPAGNGAAGTGNPALNATGGGSGVNAPATGPTTTTTGEFIGGEGGQTTGAAPARNLPGGGLPPGAINQESPTAAQPTPPQQIQGAANTQAQADDVLLRPVPARPCGVAAHETDGTTTCIGIPERRHRRR